MKVGSTLDIFHRGGRRFFLFLLFVTLLTVGYQTTVHANNTIEGAVSLPAGDVAPAGGLSMSIVSHNRDERSTESTSVFIPEGASSSVYSITVPTDPMAELAVYYYCGDAGCEQYIYKGYYASSGTTWDYLEATLLAGGVDHSGIDLTLLTGNQISGSVSLPAEDVAPPGGIWVDVRAGNGIYASGSGYSVVLIPEGLASATYTMAVPSDSLTEWRVGYSCSGAGCESYFPRGYYATGGTTWAYSEATLLPGGVDHNGIDLTLLTINQISGSVSLPAGDVAPPGGLLVDVSTYNINEGPREYSTVLIPEGLSSATYTIVVPFIPSADWRVEYDYFCWDSTDCEYYYERGYYSSGGTTWDYLEATLLAGGLDHNGIDLTLLTGNQISGSVSLPAGDVAPPGGLLVDVGGGGGYSEVLIPEGLSSVTYTIYVSPDPSAEMLVSYYCSDPGCESYFPRGYYATGGTTWASSEATLLAGGVDHNGIDLTLLTGNQISGSVSLPAEDVAPPGGIWVIVHGYDINGGTGYGYSSVLIPEGYSSAAYTMFVPPDSLTEWRVGYSCSSPGCVSYVLQGYYATSGTTWDSAAASLLSGGTDHSNINMVIMKDVPDSCMLPDESITGPIFYADDYYCSAENLIMAGDTSGVIVESGGYVVYSAPTIWLMPGFAVDGGIFRAGNSIYP